MEFSGRSCRWKQDWQWVPNCWNWRWVQGSSLTSFLSFKFEILYTKKPKDGGWGGIKSKSPRALLVPTVYAPQSLCSSSSDLPLCSFLNCIYQVSPGQGPTLSLSHRNSAEHLCPMSDLKIRLLVQFGPNR